MIASVDWGSLVPAGAFIVGVVLGAIAVIRITRVVFDYFGKQPPDDKQPE